MRQDYKRILFALMCVITLLSVKAQTIVTVDGLQFSLSGDYASVYRVASGNTATKIIVPATIIHEGIQYTVNKVSNNAFKWSYIGSYSYNSYVKEIVLPNTIRSIGREAFRNNHITKVSLQEGLRSIGAYAFAESSITELIIPNSVETVYYDSSFEDGENPFTDCKKLETLIYLSSEAPIGWGAVLHTFVPDKSKYSKPNYSFTNAKVMEMITFKENSFLYTGRTPTPTFTNYLEGYEGYEASINMPSNEDNVGKHIITIPVTFIRDNESFIVNIPYTYTITPATLNAKVKDYNRKYGEQNPQFEISYIGFVNGENESVIATKPTINTAATITSSIGTYPLVPNGGIAQNYIFEYEEGVLTIEKASLSIKVADSKKKYGDANPSFILQYSGLKNEDEPQWIKSPIFETSATKGSGVGSYIVSATCEPLNYTIINNTPGSLTISKAPLTIKANNATMDYCGIMPSYSFSYSGFKNNDNESALSALPSVVTDATATSDVGTYTITPNGAVADNYDISYISGALTIKQRPLSVKAQPMNRLYGDENPTFIATYHGFVNNETEEILESKPTFNTTANKKSSIGIYPVTAKDGAAKNYILQYEQSELTITKAPLSIKAIDSFKVYGADNPVFSLEYFGLKNGETIPEWVDEPEISTTAIKQSGVGTYPINCTCNPRNYFITNLTPGKLTITKAPLTIKANNVTMDYCGPLPAYTYSYTGFVNNDYENVLSTLPSITTDATATSNAGTYTITPQGAAADNYEIAYMPGTLTIKKRPLTVKALSATRIYGDENPVFTAEYTGFVNNETEKVLEAKPIFNTSATTQSSVGTYDVLVSGGSADNYQLNYQSGQLSITPRALKASVGNYERPYGQENPNFAIIYEGLTGNDTEYSLNAQPMVRTLATRTSNVGVYDLEVTGGYSPNYTLSYGSGKLSIVKAEQNFEWNQELDNIEVGSQIELLARASSGLPVTYTSDNNEIADIYEAGSKTYMECKSTGTFNIKAVQEGNSNYHSTQRISKKVNIVGEGEYNPTLLIKQADNGSVSMKVTKGSKHTFTVHVSDGWKIHSVTFNDTDVTDNLNEDNTFTTPAINESSTLAIVYEQTGNSSVYFVSKSTVKIQGMSYGIRVTDAEAGDTIQVFTADGVLQKSVQTEGQTTDIPLPRNNTYIIKVGPKTMKLSL